jgi:hypothetical protein
MANANGLSHGVVESLPTAKKIAVEFPSRVRPDVSMVSPPSDIEYSILSRWTDCAHCTTRLPGPQGVGQWHRETKRTSLLLIRNLMHEPKIEEAEAAKSYRRT